MRRYVISAVVLSVLFALAGCTGQDATQTGGVQEFAMEKDVTAKAAAVTETSDMLTWVGCGITKKAFMAEASTTFTEKTGVEIELSGGGATKGIRAAAGKTANLGGTCRPALPDRFTEEEKDARLTIVAWDALVFITHNDNPIDSLTLEQGKDIMLGKITNWKEVGGDDADIIVGYRDQAGAGKYSGVGYM